MESARKKTQIKKKPLSPETKIKGGNIANWGPKKTTERQQARDRKTVEKKGGFSNSGKSGDRGGMKKPKINGEDKN